MDSTLNRRRKGQTLAEFAITLPILLLMIFGIIEFGRIFQAWVSLQNAARAAARYASTGNVNYDIFVPVPDGQPKDKYVLDMVVPCATNSDGNDDRGSKTEVNNVSVYQGGSDSLFATWYDGTDCDPSNEDHLQLRKDILRLVSIMYEARESVNSLSVERRDAQNTYYEGLDEYGVADLLYSTWLDPFPREGVREWFNVMICSSRGLLDPAPLTAKDESGNIINLRLLNKNYDSRFVTIRSQAEVSGLPSTTKVYPMPYCMLNEIPPPAGEGQPAKGELNHAGIRWLDAGGAGDRVTIGVTFNHPLITPLRTGVENFLQMESRRSIVNESFRAPKAIGNFQRSLPPGNSGNPGAMETPEASKTPNPTDTPQNTLTPTHTPTDTPEPFTCDKLVVAWNSPPFNSNGMNLLIQNNNFDQVQLMQVKMGWKRLGTPHDGMYLGYMSLYNDVHWTGSKSSIVQDGAKNRVDTGPLNSGYRYIAAQNSAIWQAIFFAGPSNLATEMTLYDFDSEFTFESTTEKVKCVVTLKNPDTGQPTEAPTPTPAVPPSATPTCTQLQGKVAFRFGGFETLGGVYFEFENNTGRDLIMTGFKFFWPDATHVDIVGEPPTGYRLTKVIIGGDAVNSPDGQRIWTGDVPKGNTSTNPATYNNPTFGGNTQGQGTAVGTWVSNGTIKPGINRIWLDFDGFGGTMDTYGARSWHFDQSKLYFGCRSSAGTGGGGSSSDGEILLPLVSPTATLTPKPTNTRGPSNTPAPATPTRTATRTGTPAPVTSTFTPPPPTFTPSRTPLGAPTQPPAGGGE